MAALPPRLAAWIVARSLDEEEREEVLGDLLERFARRAEEQGSGRARRWYWREALAFSWHVGRERARTAATRCRGAIRISAAGRMGAAAVQDLRFGLRLLAARPAFTGVAVLVLALGIGANTAIFALMNETLLRPLPGQQLPGELVGLYAKDRAHPDRYRSFSYPEYLDIREAEDVFSSLVAQAPALTGIAEGDETRRTMALAVSSNFFDALGVRPSLGRSFAPEEERPGHATPVAILGNRYWRSRGADPGVLGSSLRVNGRDFTVVGVAPPGFSGTSALVDPELYVPLGRHDDVVNDFVRDETRHASVAEREGRVLMLAGRLRAGLSTEEADRRLDALARRIEQAYPARNGDHTLLARTLPRLSMSTSPRDDGNGFALFGLLQAMAMLVLLIACSNLANMMLAHASARRREIGIRLALGAGRGRIVRQLIVEGLLLATAGAAGGMLLAFGATQLLVGSLSAAFPLTLGLDGRPDLRVLAATAGFAGASTLVFALWPAWRISRTDVAGELKQLSGEATTGRRRWLTARHALVAGQIAMAMALLTAGGLFLGSSAQAARAEPGFPLRDGLIAGLDASLAGYDETRGRAMYGELLERVRDLPWVRAASLASQVPFGEFAFDDRVRRLGGDPETGELRALSSVVGGDYFGALGLPVLRGRDFTRGEERSGAGPAVAIVDEPLVRQLFPDADPLGRQIAFPGRDGTPAGQLVEIVGIVPGLRHNLFDREPVAHVYRPFGQRYRGAMTLHVRIAPGSGTSEALAGLREMIRAVDDRVPVISIGSLEAYRDANLTLWMARAGGVLISSFGTLALLLAAVGVYGVRSYLVGLRTREIGVRMALGSISRGVVWMLLRESLLVTGLGIATGLALALGVAAVVARLLYQRGPYEPAVFGGAAAILALASLVATWLPARRAARIEPFAALRTD